MKKVGILYGNIGANTGDLAIGLSVRKILADIGMEFEELVPGRFDPEDYATIIIGGGYLLRPSPDYFFDNFRVTGPHILNSCGIFGFPRDLEYLNDYLYVTVRSSGDKQKLSYLTKEVKVVPCTSMLLGDLPHLDEEVRRGSIAVQLWEGLIDEESLVEYLSSQPFHIYFLPITHYNHDFKYLAKLSQRVKNSSLLPILGPEEVFTLIGKFDYLITASLHGAIFAYVHEVPFILFNSCDKQRFFMEDRKLDGYLFTNFAEMKSTFETLQDIKPDYSTSLHQDFQTLKNHKQTIKDILATKQLVAAGSKLAVTQTEPEDLKTRLHLRNLQIRYLQEQVRALNIHTKGLETSLRVKDSQLHQLQTSLQTSIVMQLLSKYRRVIEKLLRPSTRRRYYYELGLTGIRVILNEGWRSFFKRAKDWLRFRKEKKLVHSDSPRYFETKKEDNIPM